jgi:type VI protein secretion system component VasK
MSGVEKAVAALPRGLLNWLLAGAILTLSGLGYGAVQDHRTAAQEVRSDLDQLAEIVKQLTVVVEHNYEEAEDQKEDLDQLQDRMLATQLRLERLLGKLEARVDKGGEVR